MINLMYLVLTAMLALNVSAEIINAFFSLNKGIKETNGIVSVTNSAIKSGIDSQAETNPTKYGVYKVQADAVTKIVKDFEAYINGVTDQLVKEAGGPDPKHPEDGRPVRYKDKDVTTRLFLTDGGGKGLGAEIEKRINDTRKALLATITDEAERKAIESKIALRVDAVPKDAAAKSWVDLKFKQMPVAAVMPTLTKFVADAKTSETALLNYFMDKVSGRIELKFDKFKVAIAPKKSYLVRGDKFEADVYLAAYSSNPGQNVSINVNGTGLALRDGVGRYETTPNGIGKQTVKATATIFNPATNERTTTEGTFEYEVGEKSVTVSAEKMNVFYVGVDNPIAVSAAGVSTNSLRVSCEGCESVSKVNDNVYNVRVNKPGSKANIVVTAEGGLNAKREFRIKAIPNPAAQLPVNGPFNRGGAIPSGVLQSMDGLMAVLDNFDFDAKCSIQSYVLVHIPRREDPRQSNNSGGNFNADSKRYISAAKPGDQYQIFQIKARCPGDNVARDIGSLSFIVR